jgi:hyperosmotically inducible periplasmic protein
MTSSRRLALALCLVALAAPPALTSRSFAADEKKEEQKPEKKEEGRGAGRAIADASITTAVKTALAGARGVSAHNINVDTDEGVVTLRGFAASKKERDRAEAIARKVHGVKKVVNMISIQP